MTFLFKVGYKKAKLAILDERSWYRERERERKRLNKGVRKKGRVVPQGGRLKWDPTHSRGGWRKGWGGEELREELQNVFGDAVFGAEGRKHKTSSSQGSPFLHITELEREREKTKEQTGKGKQRGRNCLAPKTTSWCLINTPSAVSSFHEILTRVIALYSPLPPSIISG